MANQGAVYRTHAEIKAKLTEIIESIPNSGQVMNLWGQLPDWALSRDDVEEDKRAWWNIRRVSNKQSWPDGAINDYQGPEVDEIIDYELRLYYPWTLDKNNDYADPSEPKFDALVDAVQRRFAESLDLDLFVYDASLLDYSGGDTGFLSIPCGFGEAVVHFASFELTIHQFQPR